MSGIRNLAGKIAVVTGAASGIGFALCERLAGEGMRLVMADIDETGLAQAADRIQAEAQSGVLAVRTDVSVFDSVAELERRAVERFGGVNLLCNNAGVVTSGSVWEIPLDVWAWDLSVNLGGLIHGIKAFVPGLIERGEPAHVVNTASIGGLLPFRGIPTYAASKYAVVGLSELLYHDLRRAKASVGVSVLCPGMVESRLAENSDRWRPNGEEYARRHDPALVRLPASEVASRVVDAVHGGRFWILTHPAYREMIERRARGIVETDEVVSPPYL